MRPLVIDKEVIFLQEKVLVLKSIPLFNSFTDVELAMIAEIVQDREYKKNRILFMEGEPGEAIFFIYSGKVKISKISEDGREHILDIAAPGDTFAEVVLFTGACYPANAEVLEDARVGLIRNADMEKLVQAHPSLALTIIQILSERLIQSQMQIKDLAFHDVFSRTASILLKFANLQGISTDQGIELSLPISRQELANMVGTTRETATRALMTFKKSNAIDINRQLIRIINIEKLKSWV